MQKHKSNRQKTSWETTTIKAKTELVIGVGLLADITRIYNAGFSVEDIAIEYNVKQEELLFILYYQAKNGKITRKEGSR